MSFLFKHGTTSVLYFSIDFLESVAGKENKKIKLHAIGIFESINLNDSGSCSFIILLTICIISSCGLYHRLFDPWRLLFFATGFPGMVKLIILFILANPRIDRFSFFMRTIELNRNNSEIKFFLKYVFPDFA